MVQIEELNVKAAILDMDGVLWRSTTPIIDLPQLFENFSSHNIKVMLATNNGTATIDGYVKKLATLCYDRIFKVVTSAMALGHLMKRLSRR
jgi:4-nitrophenyl phosphatase